MRFQLGREVCAYTPICRQITTSEATVEEDGGQPAHEKRRCYVVSRWCGAPQTPESGSLSIAKLVVTE
jgi:hypothetical protein